MPDDNVTELFTDKDREDLQALGVTTDEAPEFHPILEVWREVLSPAQAEMNKPVTPQWATRITSQYNEIRYADMPAFRDSLYGKLVDLLMVVKEEIASDAECLSYETPADDASENAPHYVEILTQWQEHMLRWEMAWDCTADNAAVEIAAISECHKMIFGQTGITAFLDNIGFEFTEANAVALSARLNAIKEGE